MTDVDAPLTTPTLSPDGSLLAASSNVGDSLYVFEIGADGKGTPRTLPDPPQDLLNQFPMGWAADSNRLLIRNRSMSGQSSFTILNMDTGEYEKDEAGSFGLLRGNTVTGTAGFSPDDKSVLAIRDSKHVVKIDLESGEETIIYEPSRSGATIDQFDLARDGSWIVILESASQSDLWMLDFEPQDSQAD